jgi:hypothetical protein
MRRARDDRLARLTAERTRRDSATGLDDCTPRAWNRVRAFVRDGLRRTGIDPECAAALRRGAAADQAAELDTRLEDEPAVADPDGLAGEFRARIAGIARRFEDGHEPDFVSASLAELLAWCLYRRGPLRSPSVSGKPPPPLGQGWRRSEAARARR